MRALLAVLGLAGLIVDANWRVAACVPTTAIVATATPSAVGRPYVLLIPTRGAPPAAVPVVQSVDVDDDDAALDDEGGDTSLALNAPVSIGMVPRRRPIAALATRVHLHGARIGTDAPRAPPSSPPIV